jgi:signal peptidase II
MGSGMGGRRAALFGIAVVWLALDQAVKQWVTTNLQLHGSMPLIPGLFALTRAHNTGAAWSMLAGKSWLLIAVAAIACVAITVHGIRSPERRWLPRIALGLILGGALGNLIDRVRLGYVVDMFDLQHDGKNIFPVFNVADIGIDVGVALLFLAEWVKREKKPAAAP